MDKILFPATITTDGCDEDDGTDEDADTDEDEDEDKDMGEDSSADSDEDVYEEENEWGTLYTHTHTHTTAATYQKRTNSTPCKTSKAATTTTWHRPDKKNVFVVISAVSFIF